MCLCRNIGLLKRVVNILHLLPLLVMRVTKKDVKREFKVTFCNINLSNGKSLFFGGGGSVIIC